MIKSTAKVVLEENGEIKECFNHENESIYVPKTTKHRLVNPGRIPLELIEVQVVKYCYAMKNGKLLYRDDDHLSLDGTFELAKFLIDKIVSEPVSH